jgi:hypothetical protein
MWKAVWSLSVWALTSAPSRSASRLMRRASRVAVPLKAMCSMTWPMPFGGAALVPAAAAHEDADAAGLQLWQVQQHHLHAVGQKRSAAGRPASSWLVPPA